MREEQVAALEESLIRSAKQFGTLWSKKLEGKVTRHQLQILSILRRVGPQKISQLADALYLTPGAMTGLSTRLEEAGYVRRIRDEGDRRTVHLAITPKGEEMAIYWKEQKEGLLKQMLSGLSDAEIGLLAALFARVCENMDRIAQELDESNSI